MDYRVIRSELVNSLEYSDDYLRAQVLSIINRLDDKIEEENKCISLSRAGSVLSDYKVDYETNVKQFLDMVRDGTDILVRMDKVREIITIIDIISYYIDWVVSRYKGSDKSALSYIAQLKSDKDTFKNSAFKWNAIMYSFNAEAKFRMGETDETKEE